MLFIIMHILFVMTVVPLIGLAWKWGYFNIDRIDATGLAVISLIPILGQIFLLVHVFIFLFIKLFEPDNA